MDKIIDNLYLTNYAEIKEMTQEERDKFIKIAVMWPWEVEWKAGENDCEPAYARYKKEPWQLKYSDVNIVFSDPEGQDMGYLDMEKLDQVVDEVDYYLSTGRKVIVFCRASMERSPTAAIRYLNKHRGLSVHDSLDMVKRLHGDTNEHGIRPWLNKINHGPVD